MPCFAAVFIMFPAAQAAPNPASTAMTTGVAVPPERTITPIETLVMMTPAAPVTPIASPALSNPLQEGRPPSFDERREFMANLVGLKLLFGAGYLKWLFESVQVAVA